ncbi:unnamed protein product [Darwinula stevensoni]|uniref:Endothelin-converting enzyme 1 n=1 Tax=Darwinula stevensoni TaxID=69355 RepID=A0A7R9FSE6_9CRUS|nr:unnamed protein product [Darwinula stevensoni]CAG0902486.1 unnamed protein product [Darwinula stevensoni]
MRPALKKIVYPILAIAVLLLIFLLVFFMIPSTVEMSPILEAMDLTVDPCEDFYRFACGSWARNNPLPAGRSTWNAVTKLERENHLVLRNALDDLMKRGGSLDGSSAESQALRYYASCMDQDGKIEELGAAPLLELIEELGGWNVSSRDFNAASWNFQKTVQTMHNRFKFGGLFNWWIDVDDRNSAQYIIQIGEGGLSLPSRDYYLKKHIEEDNVLSSLLDFMTRVGILLLKETKELREERNQSIRSQMRNVIEFEVLLAVISTPVGQKWNERKLHHKMSLMDLQYRAPLLNWTEYMREAFGRTSRSISGNEPVLVHGVRYLSRLTRLVKERLISAEGRIQLGNYLMWHAAMEAIPLMPRPFREAAAGLRAAIAGAEGEASRWEECVVGAAGFFGDVAGARFVEARSPESAEGPVREMIREIKKAFTNNLSTLKWMDEETQHAAFVKAKAVRKMIGHPKSDASKMGGLYEGVDLKPDEYFRNWMRLREWALSRALDDLGEPVDDKWLVSPVAVNAYYVPARNQMVFPAGILQPPFYSPHFPEAVNYGGIGVVIGRELMHAFDIRGREYDKHGNASSRWSENATTRFAHEAMCLAQQFARFTVYGEGLHGMHTLNENLVDQGGLKVAYAAYQASQCRRLGFQHFPLPGLNFTSRQLFFISFAQTLCSVKTKKALLFQAENEGHSPNRFRVIGALRNNEDFSWEFGCPRGSHMNPGARCRVCTVQLTRRSGSGQSSSWRGRRSLKTSHETGDPASRRPPPRRPPNHHQADEPDASPDAAHRIVTDELGRKKVAAKASPPDKRSTAMVDDRKLVAHFVALTINASVGQEHPRISDIRVITKFHVLLGKKPTKIHQLMSTALGQHCPADETIRKRSKLFLEGKTVLEDGP